ncbi:hypothetical protein M0804_001118 [Polistes exclamans]|nr:hypothetical protein M0804_001118 [Polistes exclamans]
MGVVFATVNADRSTGHSNTEFLPVWHFTEPFEQDEYRGAWSSSRTPAVTTTTTTTTTTASGYHHHHHCVFGLAFGMPLLLCQFARSSN